MSNNGVMNDKEFPLIEAVCVKSSNVCGYQVTAQAITNVIQVSVEKRLDALIGLIGQCLSAPETVKGISYADSDKLTVADLIIEKYKKYKQNELFELIWLQDTILESEYRGYAGYEVHCLRGIVLKYPNEINCLA